MPLPARATRANDAALHLIHLPMAQAGTPLRWAVLNRWAGDTVAIDARSGRHLVTIDWIR